MGEDSTVVVEANTIPGSSAVHNGHVAVMIAKMHAWMTPSREYNGAQAGVSVHPAGKMILCIPVEGVEEGSALTPLQLGEVLQTLMSTIIPACGAFVTAQASNYGVEIEEEPDPGSGDF